MAKVAPYFDLTCSSTTAWKGYVNYTLTDDPANNRTKVNAELWAYKNDGYKSGGNDPLFAPTITINGVTYGGINDRYTTESTTHHQHLVVSDVYVNHNSNGTKTLTISGNVTKMIDSTDYATKLDGKSITGSTTINLTSYTTGYTVTYNANGGSGAPSSQTKTNGVALTLSAIKPTKVSTSTGSYTVTLNANGGTCYTSSLSATKTISYTFSEWNTNSSGTGTSYNPGASYTANANLNLYAIYTSSTSTSAVTLPTPTRDGYEFVGWATSSTATSGMTGSYTPTGNVTLYAIWSSTGQKGCVYIRDNTGKYNQYIVLINDGSGWNQYVPYIYTESGWEIYSG